MSLVYSILGFPVEVYLAPLNKNIGVELVNERLSAPYRLRAINRGQQCEFCARKDSPFRCPRCKSAFYCSREHLKSDWKLHKRKCRGYTESGNQLPIAGQICLQEKGFLYYGDNLCNSSIPYVLGRNMLESENIEFAHFVVESLYLTGRCVIDNFNGNSLKTLQILKEVKTLHERGCLKDGQLACPNSNVNHDSHKIRGDKIAWVDSRTSQCEGIAQHVSSVDALMYLCNELIPEYDIQNRTKAMVACYPGNETGYKRHVDNYNKDGRCITAAYYLNKGWASEVDGGLFRMYPEGSEHVDIEPVFDRLLIFWSDRRNPHEVLPSYRTRYAITLWYFDRTERQAFIKKERLTRLDRLLKQQNESQKKEANVFKTPGRTVRG